MAGLQTFAGYLWLVFATLLCLLAPQYISHAALVLALISGASHMAHEAQSSLKNELAAWTREQADKQEFEAFKTSHHNEIDDYKRSQRNRIEKLEDEYAGVRSINTRLAADKLELGLKLQKELCNTGSGNTNNCTKMHYNHPTAETARRNEDLERKIELKIRELLKAHATIRCRDDEITRLEKTIQQQTLDGQRLESSCTALRVSAQKAEKRIKLLERLQKTTITTSLTSPATQPPLPAPMVTAQPAVLAEKDRRISALSSDLQSCQAELSRVTGMLTTAENRAAEYLRQNEYKDSENLRYRNMVSPLQEKLERAATFRADLEKRVQIAERERNQAVSDANGFYAQRNDLRQIVARLRAGLTEFGAKSAHITSRSRNPEPGTPVLSALPPVSTPDDALLAPLVSALALLPAAAETARPKKFEDMVLDFNQRYKSLTQPPHMVTKIEPDVLTALTGSDEDTKLARPLINALGEWSATKIMYEMCAETLRTVSGLGEDRILGWNASAARKEEAPEWVLAKSARLKDDRLGAVEAKRRRGMVEDCGKRMEWYRQQAKKE